MLTLQMCDAVKQQAVMAIADNLMWLVLGYFADKLH